MGGGVRRWPLNIFSRYHELPDDRACGEGAGAAAEARARMGANAAEIQATNGRRVLRPIEQRPRDEQLIERKLAVKDVSVGQAVGALEIQRRDRFTRDDGRLETRSVGCD